MGKFLRLLAAGALLLLGLAIPLLLLGWWGRDAWQRRLVAHSPTYSAQVQRKNKEWGGRAYGLEYFVHLQPTQPVTGLKPGEALAVKVTEDEYQGLKNGQLAQVKFNPGTQPRALLATSRWWTWTHVWWLSAGLLLLLYYLKLVSARLRPQRRRRRSRA